MGLNRFIDMYLYMAWEIINTHTFKKNQMYLAYSVPVDTWIDEVKVVVNNYFWAGKEDTIIIWFVWWPWRALVWWVLQRVATWAVVSDDEKNQRQLFRWTLQDYERYVEENLTLWDEDQIRTRSKQWYCNMITFWEVQVWAVRANTLKWLVIAGTATEAEKQELALLTAGWYNINNNNCTNNCSCP
jgi:hypothetical protein